MAQPWADENTSPTRKRGGGSIPRLRVGLVLKPLVQLLAAISSGQPNPVLLSIHRRLRARENLPVAIEKIGGDYFAG